MKFSVICGLAAAVLVAQATPALAAYIYTPGAAYATTEGNGNNIVFQHDNYHTQWIFNSSLFGDAPLTINGFSLRFDADVTDKYAPKGNYTLDNFFKVQASTIDGLASTTFADNLVGAKTVMSGPQIIPWVVGGPAGATKPWGITFNFQTPFDYDPTAGKNLVLDLRISAQETYGTVDFLTTYYVDPTATTPSYRIFNYNTDATSGLRDLYAPVVRFNVTEKAATLPVLTSPGAVPEPASWGLMIVGFGAAGAMLRRRRVVAAAA